MSTSIATVNYELTVAMDAIYGRQVDILPSALKHGIDEQDIQHAWNSAIRYVEYEYDGEDRLLVIGPDRHGFMLELVLVPVASPSRVIHADRLRAKFFDYLR
ncbi:hypothetical protein [Piscicoccus intestinalis]|uniref:hypothetical protein n=1 Tax=Piscicoccus intestinalis TaxID=746033 RepID=UPI001FE1257E|nr:hypothetical protein [Piscicoccus intestinalis]